MKTVITCILALMLSACGLTTLLSQTNHKTLTSSQQKTSQESTNKRHVLFVSIDDLRPELGIYGADLAITPHLDNLAKKGIRFNRAYAQQAICGPSRASIMTGLRPDTLDVTHNYVKFRHKLKDVVTIPQHFINQGYNAAYVGKIFHHGDKDDHNSWNWPAATHPITANLQSPKRYALKTNAQLQINNRKAMFAKYGEQAKYGLGSGPAIEGADVADNAYIDGYNTELAINTLNDMLTQSNKPIFLGFGMNKPHLPWIAPKKYWDLYNKEDIKLAAQPHAPKESATMGLHASFELRTFSNIPKIGDIDTKLALDLKHAYLACISYVDAQIGRMINELKQKGIYDNTVIIVWSDHGYHLGEMGIWGKASNYEIATRVPLIISTPETRLKAAELSTDALVELIDIYPTITELANIPPAQHVEGKSLVPLIKQPDLPWSTVALSQFPSPALREWGAFPLRPGMRETYFGPLIQQVEQRIAKQQTEHWDKSLFEQNVMGYSMRTAQYRLIAWVNTQADIISPAYQPLYLEVYDHQTDSDETHNIAAQRPTLSQQLFKQLQHTLASHQNTRKH